MNNDQAAPAIERVARDSVTTSSVPRFPAMNDIAHFRSLLEDPADSAAEESAPPLSETGYAPQNAEHSGPEADRAPQDAERSGAEAGMKRGSFANSLQRDHAALSAEGWPANEASRGDDWDETRLQLLSAVALAAAAPQAAVSVPLAESPHEPVGWAEVTELIERHVRELLVSDGARDGDFRVGLRLNAAVLPDTELLLSKTASGWVLRAATSSSQSEYMLSRYGAALTRRFAAKRLGRIEVETTLVPA
jgi:Type III secretion protein (HpaP)